MPNFRNLGDLIDRSRDPDKTAIVDLSTAATAAPAARAGVGSPAGTASLSSRRLSYGQLDRLASGVARYLVRRGGLTRGDRVAILSANRLEYLATLYGIQRAGLVAVPINFKLPRATIDYVMRDSGAQLLFFDAARHTDCPPGVPCIGFDGDGPGSFAAEIAPEAFDTVPNDPGECALYLYTSGSTGRPKGVELNHASHLWVIASRLGSRDWSTHRMLVAAPLYHMNALALSQLACAAHATIVLLPQFDAQRYIRAIAEERCTWLTSVPPMMAMMLRERETLEHADLSSVAIVRMGSAPVSEGLLTALRARFPRASITNAYGTTEAGPVVFAPHPDGLPTPALSVGYPHPEVQIRLVAAVDAATPGVAENALAEGVLQMKSPAVMMGYHGLPELTATVLDSAGFYRTGDVFRRDADGFYYFVGRDDDMFVSGGENIFPAEVEAMLETHEAIEQSSVVAVPDAIKGTKPAAFIVLRPGRTTDEAAVKAFALAHAPAYQHPRWVWIVSHLPLSGTNKVDRRALEQDAMARLAAQALE